MQRDGRVVAGLGRTDISWFDILFRRRRRVRVDRFHLYILGLVSNIHDARPDFSCTPSAVSGGDIDLWLWAIRCYSIHTVLNRNRDSIRFASALLYDDGASEFQLSLWRLGRAKIEQTRSERLRGESQIDLILRVGTFVLDILLRQTAVFYGPRSLGGSTPSRHIFKVGFPGAQFESLSQPLFLTDEERFFGAREMIALVTALPAEAKQCQGYGGDVL